MDTPSNKDQFQFRTIWKYFRKFVLLVVEWIQTFFYSLLIVHIRTDEGKNLCITITSLSRTSRCRSPQFAGFSGAFCRSSLHLARSRIGSQNYVLIIYSTVETISYTISFTTFNCNMEGGQLGWLSLTSCSSYWYTNTFYRYSSLLQIAYTKVQVAGQLLINVSFA